MMLKKIVVEHIGQRWEIMTVEAGFVHVLGWTGGREAAVCAAQDLLAIEPGAYDPLISVIDRREAAAV
jgi:hypothetical protein